MKTSIAEKLEELKKYHPWYGEFIGNISGFDGLPYITRDVLDKYYYNNCYSKKLIKFTTSGTSTGVKRAIYYSKDEIDYNNKQKKELFGNFINGLNPVGIVVGIGLAASSADKVFKSLNKETFIVSYDDAFDKVIQLMPKYQPEVLYSMPSLIDSIIEKMNPKLLSSVKKVILVGEILTDKARKKISSSLNILEGDILNTYGCVELGLLAFECEICKRFHFVNNIYPEVVEKQNEIKRRTKNEYCLSGNSSGILVVTSYWRKNIPALRYLTYDYIEGLAKTMCNKKEIYTFKRILGRVGDEFKHGERLSLYDLEMALLQAIPDANFKIVIQENCVKIVLKNNKNYDPKLLEKAELSINKSNSAIWHMIKNNFLKRIKIEVDQISGANANWKKRVEYNYVKTK
jgi:phenylacetate-coenzyme A ligase PaaK-like adenylate-forming protein